MYKIILLLTTALFFSTLITVNNTKVIFKDVKHVVNDTLPIIDTVGQGNWRHTLRSDSLKNLNKRDSSFLKRRKDSLIKDHQF